MLEPPAVRYVCLFVCLPLRIPCPSNRGPTPRGALRLNHSGGTPYTMARCLCDRNKTRYMRERKLRPVFTQRLFVFCLCNSLVTVCEWDPRLVGGEKEAGGYRQFLSSRQWPEVVSWMEVGEGLEGVTLLPAFSSSPPSCWPDCSWRQWEYQTCAPRCRGGQRSHH